MKIKNFQQFNEGIKPQKKKIKKKTFIPFIPVKPTMTVIPPIQNVDAPNI
jgi:hypothetical protein